MLRNSPCPAISLIILISSVVILAHYIINKVTNKKTKSGLSFHSSPPISNNPISSLASLASLPPPIPPSPTCLPPTLPLVPSCDNQTGLTGELLTTPRQLVLIILFGFEVDTLEIALKEQLDLVTMVFIVEGTRTHRGVGIYFTLTLLK